MSELSAVVREARALAARGAPMLLATVVRVTGSAYRRPGARLVATPEGVVAGSVSAGCLERDIACTGWWRTRAGAALVAYDGSSDDDARAGVGCDGVVEILLERSPSPRALAFLADCVARERTGALATVFASRRPGIPVGAALTLDDAGRVESGSCDVEIRAWLAAEARDALERGRSRTVTHPSGRVSALLEVVRPAPHLFVCGTGPDAVPLVAAAKAVGWAVTVCAPQAHPTTATCFAAADRRLVATPATLAAHVDAAARPLAVVMSHDYAADRETLAGLLASRAAYIGVLGPRRRAERMLSELAARGVAPTAADPARVRAPAGLDLGAESPAEIALAIVAEAQAVAAATSARPLAARSGPIHDEPGLALDPREAAAQ